MAKVYLFGSASLNSVAGLENILLELMNQGHEFIVADGKGADSAYHMSLSRIGAVDKATIYSMKKSYNNKYDIKERNFNVTFDEANRQAAILDATTQEVLKVIDDVNAIEDLPGDTRYIEFKDRLMMDDCAIAICAWDGSSKREFHRIQLMGIKNKPCYVYKF